LAGEKAHKLSDLSCIWGGYRPHFIRPVSKLCPLAIKINNIVNILSQEFSQFLSDIIEDGIENVWISIEENTRNDYGTEYSHCNDVIREINKNLIIQTKSNKYFELKSEYSNAQYALEINRLKIDSIDEQTTFFNKPIKYSKFERLSNLKIRSIKPDVQIKIANEVKIRSISFYSETKFEFAMIGGDNLQTHKELDRPLFDGCWLILDKEIIEMN